MPTKSAKKIFTSVKADMKTRRVNTFIYLTNYFRRNGKQANDIIDYAKIQNIPIYQRVFKDGSIGLKPQIKEDILVYIDTNGAIHKTERTTKKYNARKGITTLWKRVHTLFSAGLEEKIITKERFYLGNHLEETALREYKKGGPVSNSVISYKNRKTQFPQTSVGGNMHNFNIKKVKDEYGKFSMLYTENYPHS